METKLRVLIVDDDARFVELVADNLKYLGFSVLKASDGIVGLEKARAEKPDLIVLDVMIPEMDGYEVCRKLKSDPETRHTPILMLTAKGQLQDKVKGLDIGADDYLPKPYEKAEFEARVKALLRRSIHPPFANSPEGCAFSLACKPEHPIGVRARGTVGLNDATQDSLHLDVEAYVRQADEAPHSDWRFKSKQLGKQIYEQIFAKHPRVLSNYQRALGAVKKKEQLHLGFESTRDFLRVPLEFLFDHMGGGEDYLVLQHPLIRSITGVPTKATSLSPVFLNELMEQGGELMILLIASNTEPDIPGVDQEIEMLSVGLEALFEVKGIAAQVKSIPTSQATYERVRKELKNCRYHLIHYAGHGFYDAKSPEKSCLFFWEKENQQGRVKRLPASELQILLGDSELRFAYLSCCLSTTTGEPGDLLDDDFLGIADGIVQAGVPAVLGFRWPVSDNGAKDLALAFYESLANQGQIDTALLQARKEIAGRDRDDITWLSPVLIMQG